MENIIWVVLLCAVLALLFAAWKTSVVSKADAGTERMKEIAGNISDGAFDAFAKKLLTVDSGTPD